MAAKLTFRKTAPSVWQGNGFGYATAEWEAIVDGVVIGRWNGHMGTADYNGDRVVSAMVSRWKRDVRRMVDSSLS